jgi:hypothetical protein
MYTTNCKKFKGEIENYLAKEGKWVIRESIPNKALQELFVKIQKGA